MANANAIPLIIEAEQLHALLHATNASDLLLVDLGKPEIYAQAHIEGAVYINPAEIVSGVKPATGKLPDLGRLQTLFNRIGYHPERHIIAMDDEGGGWAGRFIWTLDMLGHQNASCLNGGIHAWLAAGLPITQVPPRVSIASETIAISGDRNVTLAEIIATLADKQSIIWDARSHEEYIGTRIAAQKAGRIPGAINFDWLDAIDRHRQFRIYTDIEARLAAAGIDGSKRIITHCHTHHRSGLTYLIGKNLGFDIKAYAGSWAEWGNHPDTPVETG